VFENGVLRIFGAKRDEVTGEWREFHNEKAPSSVLLTNYCAGDKIEKSEMNKACSADGGGGEMCTGFWWGNLRERDHWGDPGVDGRIILR
jgi:hypothetical protein